MTIPSQDSKAKDPTRKVIILALLSASFAAIAYLGLSKFITSPGKWESEICLLGLFGVVTGLLSSVMATPLFLKGNSEQKRILMILMASIGALSALFNGLWVLFSLFMMMAPAYR